MENFQINKEIKKECVKMSTKVNASMLKKY